MDHASGRVQTNIEAMKSIQTTAGCCFVLRVNEWICVHELLGVFLWLNWNVDRRPSSSHHPHQCLGRLTFISSQGSIGQRYVICHIMGEDEGIYIYFWAKRDAIWSVVVSNNLSECDIWKLIGNWTHTNRDVTKKNINYAQLVVYTRLQNTM